MAIDKTREKRKKTIRNESQLFEKLDSIDKEKVSYFIRLLMNQSKYQNLKNEISERRKEVQNGDVLTHDEIWKEFDV